MKEDLEDASNELMLSDDDNVRFVVGECFLHMDKDAAEARLQAQSSAADTELAGFRKELEAVKAKMAQLKTVLYSKFGNTINLEDEPQ